MTLASRTAEEQPGSLLAIADPADQVNLRSLA